MSGSLAAIGFIFDDAIAFRDAMQELAEDASLRLASEAGDYAIWRGASGAEIWFHLAAPAAGGEREILGLVPFFEGNGSIAVELTRKAPGATPHEGSFHAWLDAEGDGDGGYPIVFDAVDYAAQQGLPLPRRVQLRLAGFAHELQAFASAEALHAASDLAPPLATQAFLPLGLFAAAATAIEDAAPACDVTATSASSLALLTGHIVDWRRHDDAESDQAFHWLRIESLAATYDIVADPAVVRGQIRIGGVARVTCSLAGRVLD